MIIFDLEWNRGYDTKSLDEILQIGAVRIAGLGQPVTDTFNVYIRPKVHKKFGPGAKKLPDLCKSVESDVDFARGLSLFLAWCGGERELAAWGGDDFKALRQNCEYWKLPVPDFPKQYDLQRAFGHTFGEDKRQISLQSAIETCGLPAEDAFHNALHDARYTAALTGWITEEALAYQPAKGRGRRRRHRLPGFCAEPFPAQPKYRVGPCPSPEEVLNAKRARLPLCPLCGKPLCVHRWAGPRGDCWYSAVRCPEHGEFLCRLTLARTEDGQWRGRLSVPAVTPELEAEYLRALERGTVNCRGSVRKKKKRHRHRARSGRSGSGAGQAPAAAGA